MIPVHRPSEPAGLALQRSSGLERIRALGREPSSKDIVAYDAARVELWRMQYAKCCYCEIKIPRPYNDIEHYRPKCEAVRSPGATATHGYWWLAYSWENLFYACASCNRGTGKSSLFPLDIGSSSLNPEEAPPGNERPLLLNPNDQDCAEHISFKLVRNTKNNLTKWIAVEKNGSAKGKTTIEVIGLNEQDRVEMRNQYYCDVLYPLVLEIKDAIVNGNPLLISICVERFRNLFAANQQFSLFSHSVWMHYFSREIDPVVVELCGYETRLFGNYLPITYGLNCRP